jgi:protein-arginine kinase activator protein McsA
MLCEKCQEKEATVFNTHCTNVVGEVPKTSNLCSECWEASSPTAREIAAAWRAGCIYCGGEPFASAPDLSAGVSGTPKTCVLCRPCNQEFYEFINLKLPGLATGSFTPEQTANIHSIFAEVHEHMKKWASKRGPD